MFLNIFIVQIASNVAIQTFKVWFLLATLIEETASKIGMTLSGSFFTVVGILCKISFQAINLCVHVCVLVCVCMRVCVCTHAISNCTQGTQLWEHKVISESNLSWQALLVWWANLSFSTCFSFICLECEYYSSGMGCVLQVCYSLFICKTLLLDDFHRAGVPPTVLIRYWINR